MIILVGFPKSATTSFHSLFEKLGMKSSHWRYADKYVGTVIKNNKLANKPLLSGLEDLDCFTQMDVCMSAEHAYWPQLTDFKQLYYENPDAVFILPKREPVKILNSMKNWKGLIERISKYNPELIVDMAGDTLDEKLLTLIETHYHNVEKFFGSLPDAKFIIYDIQTDTSDKLTKYIDVKGNPLPHENKSV
jgi:Sulfotransferase domain